jgi:hypothetical protein
LDYLGETTWGNESNYFIANDLAGVGYNPQFGIDVSAGDFSRLTIRGTYPTNSQVLKLRIVEGDATKTFGPTTIAGLIEDIG